ncbi:MAG: EamA family transporter [Bacteroidetes bacterium]|nr:EamA family transporter [Bacteroidota bacterium]MBP7256919.1 EamA family transporter [Chitinophagales bacterium]MBK8674402.1 EamA family transporter [Bacteroidota bacterium]MBK9355454.1 EamA family transporter [Bacteroidota bacterium]MBK9635098.1 EamA family transporter [Bacteroidota bacterium]
MLKIEKKNQFLFGVIICLISAIMFSSKGVIVKLIFNVSTINSIGVLSLRMLFAFPFYLAVAIYFLRKEKAFPFKGKQWIQMLALGLLGYYCSSFFDMWGLSYISVFIERIVIFTYPTIVLILSFFFLKKKINTFQVFALVITYLGIFIAFKAGKMEQNLSNLKIGGLLVFISAFTYACYMVFGTKIIQQVGSLKFTCYALMVSSFGVFAHYFIDGSQSLINEPNIVYAYGFYLAVIGTVIPTFLTAEGIRLIGASNVAIISSIGPISTIGLAYVFLGEKITGLEILGTIFVVGGVLLISLQKK